MKRHVGLAGRVSSVEVSYTVPVEPGVEFSGHTNAFTTQKDH